MSTICSIATIIVALGSLIWILSILSLAFKRVFRKERFTLSETLPLKSTYENNKVKTSIVIIIVIILFLAGDKTFLELIGHHSLEYENSGTYCYYVELTEYHGDNTYTVPAQIRVEVDSDDDEEHRHYWRNYYIEKVYFDNGECLDFTENLEDVSLSGTVSLYDQYEIKWKCTLLNKHAFCPHIEETSHVTTRSLVELIFLLLIVLYNWIGCMAIDKKNCELLKGPQISTNPSNNEEASKSAEMHEQLDFAASAQNNANNKTGFDVFIDKYRKG